jgi:hypothetical protein
MNHKREHIEDLLIVYAMLRLHGRFGRPLQSSVAVNRVVRPGQAPL